MENFENIFLKQEKKESDVDFKRLENEVENHGWINDGFDKEFKELRRNYIENFNLKPEDSTEVIMEYYDSYYLDYINERAEKILEPGIVDKYKNSTEEEPLSFKERQDFINVLLNPMNKLYKNKLGEDVNMSNYLNGYYKNLGIDVSIKFSTIPDDQKEDVIKKLTWCEREVKQSDLEYIKNDERPIPFLIINKNEETLKIPMFGADRDVHGPVRSITEKEGKKISEKTGNFIGFKTVHEPKYSSTVQLNLGFIIHEIDHGIRNILKDQDVFKEESGIISEGSAEVAKNNFYKAQNIGDPKNGFDFQNVFDFALSGHEDGKNVSDKGLEHLEDVYASGFIMLDKLKEEFGEEAFWESAYDGQKAIPEGILKLIKEKVRGKIKGKKEFYKKVILSKV